MVTKKTAPAATGEPAVVEEFEGRLQIRYMQFGELTPYENNARTHDPDQLAQLERSLGQFGWTNPILHADGQIIAGHGRLQAAKRRHAAGKTIRFAPAGYAPTIDLSHLTPADRRAYVIADNQIALNAGWDLSLLKLEIGALQELDFNIDLLGFDQDWLNGLLIPQTPGGNTDPDATPPAPEDPVTVPGDVWLLGAHRIVCGDSTDALVVAKALNGVTPHLMVTDPPYGVEYDPAWRNKAFGEGKRSTGKVENDHLSDWREAWTLFPGDVAYVWSSDRFAFETVQSMITAGFECRSQIIWSKSKFVIGRGHYHPQHEPCWYMVRKGATASWKGDRKQTTLWQINAKDEDAKTGHGTQKPVECMKRPIENNSSPGQAIYEPFSGSGTTIIAAEMTGRACHAVELSPAYVDVAILRWQAFTGKQALHSETGQTYTQLLAERTPDRVLVSAPAVKPSKARKKA